MVDNYGDYGADEAWDDWEENQQMEVAQTIPILAK